MHPTFTCASNWRNSSFARFARKFRIQQGVYHSKRSISNSSCLKENQKWADRTRGLGFNVFAELTSIAQKYQAVNLGQGFPDFPGPQFILDGMKNAATNNANLQYTRFQGQVRLVNALSKYFSPKYGKELNPMDEIIVTVGATEGIFATMQAFINPGDEVLLIEPFYDSYVHDINIAGGIPKAIPLRFDPSNQPKSSDGWKIDFDKVEQEITPRTKMIVLNNPQNAIGKVYTRSELEGLANLAKKHDLLVLSDEVYEQMVYGKASHVKIATLPGMYERTITLGSAGKSFSVTGFKIGWAIGPKHLISALSALHQHIAFCTTTPLQEAVGEAFDKVLSTESSYFDIFREDFQRKRDKLSQVLSSCGLSPIIPDGSYFVMADFSKIDSSAFYNSTDSATKDFQFCKWLASEVGVVAIPPSAFFHPKDHWMVENLARFCFCKQDETLDNAEKRLQKLKSFVN